MEKQFAQLKKGHPCLSQGPQNTARIHLPVSGACNIGCRFCDRCLNEREERPGVCSGLISPEQALRRVRLAVEECPQLTVVGIAGPGDPLASEAAIETFRLVKQEYPGLFRCLSTNGLELPDRTGELQELGIHSLTVTVNSLKPKTLARLNAFAWYRGQRYEAEEAAELLIARQLEGIRRMAQTNTLVKINTVLVPGINDHEIGRIAERVSREGASMYNIIPLIPQHELADISAPGCQEVNRARQEAEQHIQVFRHCRHCRADAVGIPGREDLRRKIFGREAEPAQNFSHG